MHSNRLPSIAVEVTGREQPSGIEQKHHLAIAPIREQDSEPFEFRIFQDSPAWGALQFRDDCPARFLVEKPVARHCRVIHCEVVLRHREPKSLDLSHQIVLRVHRRHAMIRDYGESHLRVLAGRNFEYFAKLLIIPSYALSHRLGIIALTMKKMVHLAKIEEEEIGVASLYIAARLLDDPGVGQSVIRVDSIGNVACAQQIKDRY